MPQTIKLSLLSVALLSQLNADNQYTLQTIDVTASQGTTLNKKDVTDNVIIITKEALEESHLTSLGEALNKLGNISTTQSGGIGQQSSTFVRGMDTKRTLVLIDGIRYNNPTSIGGVAEFSQIMLYDVEQIEIIKGAQSGVWGSDAAAGVINIVTSKAKQGLHGVANIEYGSFDSVKTSLQASYATTEFDFLVGGLLYQTDGFSAVEPNKSSTDYGNRYDDLGLEKDSYTNKSLNAKFGYNITDSDRVEVKIQAINSLVDFDSGAGSTNDSDVPNTQLQNRFYNIAYKHKDALNDLTLLYNLSTFDRDMTGDGWAAQYTGSVKEVKLDDKVSYMKDSFIKVGASYQKFEQEEIASADKSYSSLSAFITNYNKVAFVPGLSTIITESIRYDKYDDIENSLTGKLGIKQFIFNDYYISANVGTGFNSPTLDELYGAFGANPNLEPETSLTSDITIGNDIVWVTGFYNEIDDLITYTDPDGWSGPLLGAYTNLSGKSRFKGIEVGYEDYYLNAVGMSAMYTYVKTENANGASLARRPKTQIDAKATYYASETLDFGLILQYIGERYDQADKQGAQTGRYTITNFVTNIKANDSITFYGKIDNITDKYYQTVDGYATAGRSLYIGLNGKF